MNGPIVTSGSAIHKNTCTHDFLDPETTMVEARGGASSRCAKMVEKEIKHGFLLQSRETRQSCKEKSCKEEGR